MRSHDSAGTRRISPVLGVVYILVVAVASFILDDVYVLGLLVAAQVVLGVLAGVPVRALLQPFRKLAVFSLIIVVSYALLGADGAAAARTTTLPLWPWPISITGLMFGCAMVLRVLCVVSASAWVRSQAGAGDFVVGLKRLGMPRSLAELLDRTLELLEGEPGIAQHGHGRHRHQHARRQGAAGLGLRKLMRGDLSGVVTRVRSAIDRAGMRDNVAGDSSARDLAILSGLLLVMFSLKAVKVLPGLPFAPGHKGVILLPMYLVAATIVRRRGSATLLGSAFGLLSFLFGDGRYGVLEILKHITPGLCADALAPVLRRKQAGIAVCAAAGAVLAVARWATIAVVVLMVEAPGPIMAALLPVGVVHLVFGMLSGVVTRALLASAELTQLGAPTGGFRAGEESSAQVANGHQPAAASAGFDGNEERTAPVGSAAPAARALDTSDRPP